MEAAEVINEVSCITILGRDAILAVNTQLCSDAVDPSARPFSSTYQPLGPSPSQSFPALPSPLAPFYMKDQWLYSEFPPYVECHTISHVLTRQLKNTPVKWVAVCMSL